MLNRIRLVRNIGQFDSVQSSLDLTRFTAVYAENGRGKTTLAAILRSLATGDAVRITERRRLAAQNPPHVIIDSDGGPPQQAIFTNGAWNRSLPNIAIFDDTFVDENVCSGITVDPEHRQKLHDLILGARGVALSRSLQKEVEAVEVHNRELRTRGEAIPAAQRGGLSAEGFCALPRHPDIDAEILACERQLAAARDRDAVRTTSAFLPVALPAFPIAALGTLLAWGLPDLDAAALAQVQAHFAGLGHGGEAWVAEGIRHSEGSATCPFCSQDLGGSPLIGHYRAYFSAGYQALKKAIADAIGELERTHGRDAFAGFERAIRQWSEGRMFWARFTDMPELGLDTAAIVRDWGEARDRILEALRAKQQAPLEPGLSADRLADAVVAYERHRQRLAELSRLLVEDGNRRVRQVKEGAAAGNAAVLGADLVRLRAIRARHTPAVSALCDRYIAEKQAKELTEARREAIRIELDHHRQTEFPAFETAINRYLRRLNAGFRLDRVASANTRGGPSCTYNVLVNDIATPIAVSAAGAVAGDPSFRNSLSAGDRNTLALAFFFASLDRDPQLADRIVVIDDPMTSLDEHRTHHTVAEIGELAHRTSQVIVLSHDKPFLCRVWESVQNVGRTALQLVRDGAGSTIQPWNVNQDLITEHDRRHALLSDYVAAPAGNSREVATALRPHLEAFVRVAFPGDFPPGEMLGSFRHKSEQRVGTPRQVLSATDTNELRQLVEFGNLFHHDTNALGYQTVRINDAALLDFVRRTLAFTRR